MSAADAGALVFTGERFTPECVREMWLEHWHRYVFALPFARDKRVLDAACGEGYGAALLAHTARHVTGADLAEDALAHARARYSAQHNLEFVHADATRLERFADASFDLVVSFETLEHLHAHDELLAGFARVLAPSGLLIVSTPDKRIYSDATGYRNEFHVRELYRAEFEALLTRHFAAHHLFGQKLLFQSVLFDLGAATARARVTTMPAGRGLPVEGLAYEPVYLLAVAAHSAEALPDLAGISDWFGDAQESVYAHYANEIRQNIAAGGVLAAHEVEIARLKQRLRDAGIDPDLS